MYRGQSGANFPGTILPFRCPTSTERQDSGMAPEAWAYHMHSTRLSLNCRPHSDERALRHKREMRQKRLLRQFHNIWRQGVVHDTALLGAPAKEVVDNIILSQN